MPAVRQVRREGQRRPLGDRHCRQRQRGPPRSDSTLPAAAAVAGVAGAKDEPVSLDQGCAGNSSAKASTENNHRGSSLGETSGPDQSTTPSESTWGLPPWGRLPPAGPGPNHDPGSRLAPSPRRIARVAKGGEAPRGVITTYGAGRKCDNAMLTTVEEVHRKTGVTSVHGVAKFKSLHLDRFQAAAAALA